MVHIILTQAQPILEVAGPVGGLPCTLTAIKHTQDPGMFMEGIVPSKIVLTAVREQLSSIIMVFILI